MAVIHSKQDGDWSDMNTWEGGAVPGTNDVAVVWHTVAVDGTEGGTPTGIKRVLVEAGGKLVPKAGDDRYMIIQDTGLNPSVLGGNGIDTDATGQGIKIKIVGCKLRGAHHREIAQRIEITL